MLSYFIARKIHFGKTGAKRKVSRPAVRVATIGITIGIAVMLISISVILGFKTEVQNKITGFGSHIQIVNFDNNNTYEMQPIQVPDSLYLKICTTQGVRCVQKFTTKPGIIKSATEVQGIILKGVDITFDWDFFSQNLIEGTVPNYTSERVSNEIIISKYLSKLLGLNVGDKFFTYFIQENVRARRFTVCGIYNTDFIDYDRMFIIGDMRHVQQLNAWSDTQYSGLEILIDEFDKLNLIAEDIYFTTANKFDGEGNTYYVQTIEGLNPQVFSWLDLLDVNVVVIILLMLSVAGFNIISSLLILIIENTTLIGTIKSLGGNNWLIRRIFLWQSTFLILKGMFWGNVIGIGLCLIQSYFKIIPLDAVNYYVNTVPIALNFAHIILLNIGTIIVTVLMLIVPSYLIARISPSKVMRFQ